MEYSFRNASSFLTDEEVQDVFLMDNSATRQVTCKRGSGKLRHVSDASGKVLWCQEVISSREVEVKQVEQFTMCQIDRDGGRVGEKERQEVGKRERERCSASFKDWPKHLRRLCMQVALGQWRRRKELK